MTSKCLSIKKKYILLNNLKIKQSKYQKNLQKLRPET